MNEKVFDGVLLAAGSMWSLANLEETLGVVLLIIQITWLLIKFIDKLIYTIRNKDDLSSMDEQVSQIISLILSVMAKLSKKNTQEDDNGTINTDDSEIPE